MYFAAATLELLPVNSHLQIQNFLEIRSLVDTVVSDTQSRFEWGMRHCLCSLVWDILVAGILDFVALDVCVAPSSVSRLSKKKKEIM